jgi:hypothetical protein
MQASKRHQSKITNEELTHQWNVLLEANTKMKNLCKLVESLRLTVIGSHYKELTCKLDISFDSNSLEIHDT